MMETMKMNDAAKRLFDKLGIVGWASVALSVILFSFGLWMQFHSVGGPLTATYRDDAVYVEASYGEEAEIPSDTEFRASLVLPENDPDAYMQKMAAAMTAMGRDGETAPANAIYHVGFYVGEQEIEPAAPVSVNIWALQDGFAVGQPIHVVHLGENGAEVIADTLVDDAGRVSFTTDSFSDFVFVQTGEDEDGEQDGDAPDMEETSGTEGTSSMEGNGIVGSGIVDSGRSWMGITMMDGEIDGPTFDGAISPIANGPDRSINLNDLTEDEVSLTFQYMEDGTWHNVPDGKNIFDYYNSDISINFQFNKDFTQEELTNANGKLTYDLPPYLKDFGTGVSGELKDQNGKVAGTVTVDGNGKVTIQLTDDFIKNNSTAKNLHFSLSGHVDLNKATDKEVGDQNYPGFNLKIPTDEREAHSRYGTLQLKKECKSSAPKRDEDGNWYVDYELTVTAPDFEMPDVSVEDVFHLDSADENVATRLRNLINSYVKYSVNEDTSMDNDVGDKEPAEKIRDSVYQTFDEDGVPQLNWYLGDMTEGESRTLHYRVKLNQDKMETTNFTKDGTILPNAANAFSKDYPKANADAQLSLQTYVYVSKLAQENQDHKGSDPKVYFVPDGEGGGYIEYKVTVRNDKEYPVNVKVYDSVNDPNTNRYDNDDPNKGEGLSYDPGSFEFRNSKGELLEPTPQIDFSVKDVDGAKYTSFTAHIGWLDPHETVTFTYKIHISAEELAAGKVDVHNGVLALFEGQDKTGDTYSTWLERYQQDHTVEQESWAAKNYGGAVEPQTITFGADDKVYDATSGSVTPVAENPGRFELGKNSFQYTVTVNGNTVWDVSSATMGDQLSNGLQYSGYVKVVAKGQDGAVLGTAWVKVDGLKIFGFTGKDIGFSGEGTSYTLTYYTTVEDGNNNFHIVLENDFSLEGTIIGPGGEYIQVNVQDSTSNTGETSNHLEVTKDAWYYEPDKANLGAFYWVVKVDASYIPNGFALRDVAGDNHDLREDSLLGVYAGPEAYEFDKDLDWAKFQDSAEKDGFTKFEAGKEYSSAFDAENGLTVTFQEHTPSEGAPYVYLFFKTYVTGRQAEPYQNNVYSNSDDIPGMDVDYYEDDATNNLPGVGDVEKMGLQAFDWDGSKITPLNGSISSDYVLDAGILEAGNVPAGRYAAWSVSVNKKGGMEGDFTITDQIPDGMELSFVAIAKTVNILQPNTNNTPPWAITLDGKGESMNGLLVGHAKAHQNEYTTGGSYKNKWDKRDDWQPWTGDNWKYYLNADGTVSWGVHIENGMCISNEDNKPISAYEVDYLVVCRVTDDEVLLGVTKGDPEKIFNNHVTVVDGDNNTVANADAKLTVPCKPVVTKDGVQDVEDGHKQQTIKFTLKVNEEATTVENVGDTLTLKDEMSKNLILVRDSVKFYSDPDCKEELTGASFISAGNLITFTIPNGKAVYIQYECLINAPAGSDEETPVENTVYFDKRQPGGDDGTWTDTVKYDPSGGIEGNKKMKIVKKDPLTGEYLEGAEFAVTLLGTTDENGTFAKERGETKIYKTGEDGFSEAFEPVEGGLYEVVETKAPDGYVPDSTPKYYWVGRGSFEPPTAKDAGLTGEPTPTITAMYIGTIDVEILNEEAKITVKKKFVNAADGSDMSDTVTGTYTFGLFTKDGENYVPVMGDDGKPYAQSLTFPGDKDKPLTFYVPYSGESQDSEEPPVEYYYVLEVDEDGNPIDSGVIGTMEFEPSYEYSSDGDVQVQGAASSDNAETTVTVTNTCYATYRLPESGGMGTTRLYVLGTAFVLTAALSLVCDARRRKARD